MRQWLILWAVLLCTTTAQANDEYVITPAIQAIPEGPDRIVALKEGAPAPFAGHLYDPMTALRWANWLSQMKMRLVLDVTRERGVCRATSLHQDRLLAFEEERNAVVEEDLRVRLTTVEQHNSDLYDRVNNPSFFRSMEFGVLLGVAGSVAVAVAVSAATN